MNNNDFLRSPDVKKNEKIDVAQFPRHLFIPSEAQSVDIRNAASLNAGETFEILRFVAPPGQKTYFFGYAIFNDGLLFDEYEFIPRVDGRRILPYHGNPMSNYKISLGVSDDVANSALMNCAVGLEPGQVLTWTAVNASAVATVMAVRMVGYVNPAGIRTESRVGG